MPEQRRRVMGLLGLPMDKVTLQEATDRVRQAARSRQRLFLSTPNLNFLMACQTDLDFRWSVIDSDLSTADGMPLVWLSRWLGSPLPERVTGSDIFERLKNEDLAPGDAPLRVYFFGGPDGAAQRAGEKLDQVSKSLRCAGHASPGFGTLEALSAPHWIEAINESEADMLIIAMGAIKGQAWLQRNRSSLQVPVICHLGAVINFAAGSVMRAPSWVQRAGLEWLWRIKEEPLLWRRYFQDARLFGRVFLHQLLPCKLQALVNSGLRKSTTWQVRMDSDPEHGWVMRLSGACIDADDDRLKEPWDKVKCWQNSVILDMTNVDSLGPDFVGGLLDMCRLLRKEGKTMGLMAVRERAKRLLSSHGLSFLLLDEGFRP